MRLPIRNKTRRPLTLFMEPICNEFQIPAGGEGILRIADDALDSLDVNDGWVTIYDNSAEATVEIISEDDMRADDAIQLACTWLDRFGARDQAQLIEDGIAAFESVDGYFKARRQVFAVFHDGFADEDRHAPVKEPRLAACYQAGVTAARLNQAARDKRSFPELNAPAPLDTDVVRSAFTRALADGGSPD